MAETQEPRALNAALASPAFVTQAGGSAMHTANRHVERWAPEAGASRVRPLRNLGFVDRLVSPWIDAAQRSASLRLFSQYIATGTPERQGSAVSWVFPRPWYQDELDWMAAARHAGEQARMEQPAPTMLTTRGTYVPAAQASPGSMRAEAALPAALYEYVAPSLSVARPAGDQAALAASPDAYSPLVPFAAAQAAQVMARVIAPLQTTASGQQAPRMTAGLRAVLSTMLERTAMAGAEAPVTRLASAAPELVTPPAPRPEAETGVEQQVIREASEQRAHVAELQRVARIVAERELVAREAAVREAAARQAAATTTTAATTTAGDAERARIEARIAERLAERQDAQRQQTEQQIARQRAEQQQQVERQARATATQRLHEQAREAAARDARESVQREAIAQASAAREAAAAAMPASQAATTPSIPAELTAAIAALPPELASTIASGIGQHPERAVQAIRELDEALRAVELIARTSAAGGTFESTRGPRLVMPAGLGGLVATVERATALEPARGAAGAMRPIGAAALAAEAASGAQAAALERAAAPASRTFVRVPSMAWLAPEVARDTAAPAPTSAFGAAVSSTPAALHHVAWADRWLARFAGAAPRSLDVLDVASASPETRLQTLASAAPGVVWVAPELRGDAEAARSVRDAQPAGQAERTPVLRSTAVPTQAAVRIADDAETPDDLFAAISAAATRTRSEPASAARAAVAAASAETPAPPRETLADLVAHAAPAAPGAGFAAQLASSPFAPALRHVLPMPAAPSFDVRALFGSGLVTSYLAGLVEAAAGLQASGFALDWSPTYVAPDAADPALAEARSPTSEVLTMRSSLLSWEVEARGEDMRVFAPAATSATTTAATASPLARTLVDSLALPMLGETAAVREPAGTADVGGLPKLASFAAPGMIADRAQSWSVAQERSASDLSFDFVPPELVLAARVYGLGPAEAAQAARLAIAGPGQLSAMASAVDRTFVQVMNIDAERRAGGMPGAAAAPRGAVATMYPTASGEIAAVQGTTAAAPAMFGVDRRAPRGAFLWPSATVAALGLNAPAPDGELSMSIAALELLAAQAVAEIGTYAALGEAQPGAAAAAAGEGGVAGSGTISGTGEAEVLAAAVTMVPSSRRAKFEAMYVALGRGGSPAARAARAIALAGRGEEMISARERATLAWDVLPVVYAQEPEVEQLSTGAAAVRDARRRAEVREYVEGRPGLGMLSARAGEALGSYVAPSAPAPASASTRERDRDGAVMRAPTAAQELVRTGRPAGRHGGGEVEIPPWFEAAARKMFEDKSSAEGVSLAELTLVTSAPSTQIAASTRAAPSAVPPTPAPNTQGATQQTTQIDIDKVANEVYRQILVLMEAARARNGEPYL